MWVTSVLPVGSCDPCRSSSGWASRLAVYQSGGTLSCQLPAVTLVSPWAVQHTGVLQHMGNPTLEWVLCQAVAVSVLRMVSREGRIGRQAEEII